jgi:hypothetical protein
MPHTDPVHAPRNRSIRSLPTSFLWRRNPGNVRRNARIPGFRPPQVSPVIMDRVGRPPSGLLATCSTLESHLLREVQLKQSHPADATTPLTPPGSGVTRKKTRRRVSFWRRLFYIFTAANDVLRLVAAIGEFTVGLFGFHFFRDWILIVVIHPSLAVL